jgi:hypothetical protein
MPFFDLRGARLGSNPNARRGLIMSNHIIHHHNDDGIYCQGFLKIMAWPGTGVFCVLKGAGLKSCSLSQLVHYSSAMKGDPGFVRMSDNHLGFDKPANAAVIASLRNWITHEQTIQDQVTLETTKPGVYRVTGNIQ